MHFTNLGLLNGLTGNAERTRGGGLRRSGLTGNAERTRGGGLRRRRQNSNACFVAMQPWLCLNLIASGLHVLLGSLSEGGVLGPMALAGQHMPFPEVYMDSSSSATCETRALFLRLWQRPCTGNWGLLLRLRGAGRRRMARPMSRMKLGHLSKVVERRASNIARRQQKDAQDKAHYGKADGVWEVMNPDELKEIRKEEKTGMKEAKSRVARKMVEHPDSDVSSEEVGGRKVIVDFADVQRAKHQLAAAATMDEDREEDDLDCLAPFSAAGAGSAAAAAATLAAARASGGVGAAVRDSSASRELAGTEGAEEGATAYPPRGALVYPVGSKTALSEAVARLRDNQTLWLEQGRHKWEALRKSSKQQAEEFEEQRWQALTDWEYEPLDDRLAGRAIYDDFFKSYYSLDPLRVTHLPSLLSLTTLREILPRFDAIDPARFLYLLRRNLDIRGAPAGNRTQFPLRQAFPLSIARGQWLMGANSSGSVRDVLAQFYRPFVDGGEQCMRVLGGPWQLEYCGVRCGGGQCLVCEGGARVSLRKCSVGGIGAMLCAKGQGKLFASDGVVVMHSAAAELHSCCFEQTGMLKGAAARAVDRGNVTVSDSHFRNIRTCALSVCGHGRVHAKRCVFRDLQAAAFAAGPRAMDAERLPAPVGPGHSEVRERVFSCSRGARTRYADSIGVVDGLGRKQRGKRVEHDGPSDSEDEEEFGWLLGDGIAPGPAPRAWGTEMVLEECRVFGEPWHNVTRPGILREGGNEYYIEPY